MSRPSAQIEESRPGYGWSSQKLVLILGVSDSVKSGLDKNYESLYGFSLNDILHCNCKSFYLYLLYKLVCICLARKGIIARLTLIYQ